MTVTCPNCEHDNLDGALFCGQCGAKLVSGGVSTAAVKRSNDIDSTKPVSAPLPPPPPATEAFISLHVVRTGQILPLVGRSEFTIGRVSEGQSILPDIDLTPYEAYSQGVSRLHSTIKRKDDGHIVITDLGSSNGTRVNNEKIPAHTEQKLSHGDVISIGQFKLQALIRQD